MLRTISWQQFRELELMYEIEPFGEERDDWRMAHFMALVANIAGRDPKTRPKPYTIKDFVFDFDTVTEDEKPKQSVSYMTMLINSWIDVNNMTLKEN